MPRPATTVGVFVNQPAEHIREVSRIARLAAVQLHGDETPAFAAEMTLPVIKSVRLASGRSIGDWPMEVTLLADVNDPVRRGGTGLTVDWLAAAVLAGTRRLLLAGGLNPENVADAIARVQPYGIDVSSGVERRPASRTTASWPRSLPPFDWRIEGLVKKSTPAAMPEPQRKKAP